MFGKPGAGGVLRRRLMASVVSLSSLLQTPRPTISANPKPNLSFSSARPRTFWCCVRAKDEKSALSPPPAAVDRRSLAVSTGDFFLGLASLLLKSRSSSAGGAVDVPEEEEKVLVGDGGVGGKRIVSVVEEPVVWERRPEDLESETERSKVTSPGFSFSAAGLLFPYHLGVANFLLEKGYIKETTPLAGSSAGAIVCAVIASGSSMKDALQVTKILADDCRIKGTAFRLGKVLRNVLEEFLPDDVHTRSSGRIRVAITQLSWKPRGLVVDQFDSKEDLINAVITSSFVPGICAFPTKIMGLRDIGISPDCNPENRASPRQLFNWALEPAEDNILDRLYELGYLDATVWAEQNPLESLVIDESCPN